LENTGFQKDGLPIIAFDEADLADFTAGGGHVAVAIVSPLATRSNKSIAFYQHQSVLRSALKHPDVMKIPGQRHGFRHVGVFQSPIVPRRRSVACQSATRKSWIGGYDAVFGVGSMAGAHRESDSKAALYRGAVPSQHARRPFLVPKHLSAIRHAENLLPLSVSCSPEYQSGSLRESNPSRLAMHLSGPRE
jgi:hypothetical protein